MPSPPSRLAVSCPDGEMLHALRRTTPLVAVDLVHLRDRAGLLGEAHAAREIEWVPETTWAGVSAVAKALRDGGAASVSCNSLRDALAAVKAQADLEPSRRSVTILMPPVVGNGPDQLARLAGQASVSVVVDHFAQAERLGAACETRSSTVNLMLRVDVGRERLGVRPGPDLHDLAGGVARLPGVRLAGIAVAATSIESSGLSGLRHSELARLLARCCKNLAQAGFPADVISVSNLADVDDSDAPTVATQARTAVPSGPDSPFLVVAGVIGRPTRHQAVIDAGRSWLGDAAAVVWPAGHQARLAAIDDGFAVLQLHRAGHGLVIGDTVALVPMHAPAVPQCPVLLGDCDGWRTAPADGSVDPE